MKKRGRLIIGLGMSCLLSAVLSFSGPLSSGKSRLEAFLFLGSDSGAGAVGYAHDFPIEFWSSLPGSRGFQTLTVERKWGLGIQGGLSYFISDRFGLKLNLAYSRHSLGGENSPYMIHLEYVVATPPDYVETRYSHDNSTEWRPTQGRHESWALSLNALYKFPLSRNATASVSAGPGLLCSFGRFNYLGYTFAWTQPFGIPGLDEYLLMMELPAAWTACLNLDFEVSLRLSRLLSLAARVGYVASTSPSAVPSIDKVLFYDSLAEADPVASGGIKSDLSFEPIELHPSALSLSAGLKLQL